jgi:hypothetical protein
MAHIPSYSQCYWHADLLRASVHYCMLSLYATSRCIMLLLQEMIEAMNWLRLSRRTCWRRW